MTERETAMILASMQAAYPTYKPPQKEIAVKTWHMALEDYPYEQVSEALKIYIRTNTTGFAPSPGQLIDKIFIAEDYAELPETTAWGMVSDALKNGIYGYQEEFQRLPETVKKAVGGAENIRRWAMMDTDAVESVIQSNFMRTYRSVLETKKEMRRMPENVKRLVMETARRIEAHE